MDDLDFFLPPPVALLFSLDLFVPLVCLFPPGLVVDVVTTVSGGDFFNETTSVDASETTFAVEGGRFPEWRQQWRWG